MVAKSKKSSVRASKRQIKLVKLLCENCGETIEVPIGSDCYHCGAQLVKDAKWRHKK